MFFCIPLEKELRNLSAMELCSTSDAIVSRSLPFTRLDFTAARVWIMIHYSTGSERYYTILLFQAFTIIDQDRDGFISDKDLKDMWASLGKTILFLIFTYLLIQPNSLQVHGL